MVGNTNAIMPNSFDNISNVHSITQLFFTMDYFLGKWIFKNIMGIIMHFSHFSVIKL